MECAITYDVLYNTSASVMVVPAAPGILVYGSNWAVVQNSDYSVNGPSNPAKAGSYITVYGTGAGAVSPPVPTGSAAPSSPLSVAADVTATINGVPSNIGFAGLTPGAVGLLQVNAQVPALPAGVYPLQISVGGAKSNSATLAIGQ